MGIAYATREALRAALDVAESPRADGQIDRLIDAASRSVESLTHRIWYPTIATRYWAWPDRQQGTSYRLWLDDSELLSVSSITSGGTTIPASEYFLEPNRFGPPYNRVELDLDDDAAFGGGTTHQRDITITGVFGACNDTATAGVLDGAINSSVTTVRLNTGEAVGVGDLLILGTEYMQVTNRALVDTTVNLGGSGVTASKADVALTVADGTAFAIGELLRIDAERMLVVDTGATLVYVRRAHDGTALASHAAAADIYAARSFTVRRGQLGTTAASHLDDATVSRHAYPGLISTLAIDEALWSLQNEQSGMARTIGGSENARQVSASSIADLRKRVREAHGRTMRKRVI